MRLWQSIKPYIILARLHRPVGTVLVLGPALWSIFLASGGKVDYSLIVIFSLGAIVMRSAGCVINDIMDRKIDQRVSRTKNRPLALAQPTVKLGNAVKYALFWCVIGLILVLQLNLYALLISLVSMYLILLYPYTKRLTYWPQLFLGMSFATAVPMAYVSVLNYVNLETFILFFLVLIWAFIYDTEYAMVDKEDDEVIKVRSTAVLFGKFDVLMISLFMLIFVSGLFYLGYYSELQWQFFASLWCVCLVFIYQLYLIQNRQPKKCLLAFHSNQLVSIIVLLGIVFSS